MLLQKKKKIDNDQGKPHWCRKVLLPTTICPTFKGPDHKYTPITVLMSMKMRESESETQENEWMTRILFKMNVIFLFHKVLCCFVMLNPYKGRHVWIPETCFYFFWSLLYFCVSQIWSNCLYFLYFCEDFRVFCPQDWWMIAKYFFPPVYVWHCVYRQRKIF